MEVHHHAHKPKNWKEYITEFIMLFTAVTLGFFAENLREHQVVIERKNKNLDAIYEDLKHDSVQIESRIKEYTIGISTFKKMEEASLSYQRNLIDENTYINLVTDLYDSSSIGTTFFINNSAYKNTISSGSLSVINADEVKHLIAEYYEELGLKLIDNNRLFDEDRNDYIQKTFQFINIGNIYSQTPEHKEKIKDFKSMIKYRNILVDPSFRINTFKFTQRCGYYIFVLGRFKEVNRKLMKALENQ